jgi:uncharacterized protein (DUF1501 family)
MKRREFIKSGSILSIPVFLNGFGIKMFATPPVPTDNNGRVLVLIQLDGGNDTLNTVIPIEYYSQLSSVRQNILIPENKILKLDDKIGLHPAMTSLKSLYDSAYLNIVRAVSYPNQNRSHFRSTDIWMSGSSAENYESTGWLGRYFSLNHSGFPEGYPNANIPYPFAITISSTSSETCQGVKANFSLAVTDPKVSGQLFEGEWDTVPQNCYGENLSYIREMVRQSNNYSDIVSESYQKGNSLSTKYNSTNKLASDLKIVAKLISGGLQTQVYVLRLGGFDTHSGQVDANDKTIGAHSDLLRTLSDAIGAFQDDLNLLGIKDKVLGMTFSEFGRQIRSNGSLGTDHGTAVDVFMFGSCVKPGLTGINPIINSDEAKGNGVAMQNDYRSVYSSVLTSWLGVKSDDAENLLFGEFNGLDIISECSSTPVLHTDKSDGIFDIYPNPVSSDLNIYFNKEIKKGNLKIYNSIGKIVYSKNSLSIDSNSNQTINIERFLSGNYYLNLRTDTKNITKKFTKI